MRFHWTEKLLLLESVSEKKLKTTVSSTVAEIRLKYWSRSNCNNGFQKNLNERILFPVNRKSFATDCNQERIRLKDISKRWENCFQWKGCLRYWNEMVSTSRKIRFHWPEWRICFKNTFSLDEKKTVINVWCLHKSLAETSEKLIKKTVSTCQKITFH